MGLLNIFNKKKNNNQSKNVKTQTPTNYTIEFPNSNMQLEFYDIKMYNQVDYEKELSNLFTARVQEVDENHTMMFDEGNFICFEIPEDMTIEKMFKAKLLEGMLQIGRFNGLDKGIYNHVGRIKQKEDGTFTIQEPTDSVMNYVRTNLDGQILEKDRMLDEKMQKSAIEEEKHKNEFKMQLERQANQYKELVNKERSQRKNNPFLNKVSNYKGIDHFYNGTVKTLSNYQGVDVQTGEILKLCSVNKIAKDAPQNGIYVYSAYVDRTDNENEMFFETGEPIGSPVVFETAIKVDDIIASNDKHMINSLLTLLSTKTQQNSEHMKYIGGINRNGQISDTYISQTFAQRIPGMIDKFNNDIELKKQNRGQRT